MLKFNQNSQMRTYFFILVLFFLSYPYSSKAQQNIDTTLTFRGHIGNYPDYKGVEDLMKIIETGVSDLLKKNTEYEYYSKKNDTYFLEVSCTDKTLVFKFNFIRTPKTNDGLRYFGIVGGVDSIDVNTQLDREITYPAAKKVWHFYETKDNYNINANRKNNSVKIDNFYVKEELKEIFFKFSYSVGFNLYPSPIPKENEYYYQQKIALSKETIKPYLSVFFLNNLKLQHGEARRYFRDGSEYYAESVEEGRLMRIKYGKYNTPATSKTNNPDLNSNDLGKNNTKDIASSKTIKDNKNSIWSDDPAIFLKQLSVAEAAIKNSKLSNSKKQEALAKIIPLKKQARELIDFKKLGQDWDDFLNQTGRFDKNGKIVKSQISKYFNDSENKLLLKILNQELNLDPQSKNWDRCGNTLENCKFCGRQINVTKYYRSIGFIIRDLDGLPVMVRLTDSEIKEVKYYLARIRSGSYYVCLTNDKELFCTKEHSYLFNKR